MRLRVPGKQPPPKNKDKTTLGGQATGIRYAFDLEAITREGKRKLRKRDTAASYFFHCCAKRHGLEQAPSTGSGTCLIKPSVGEFNATTSPLAGNHSRWIGGLVGKQPCVAGANVRAVSETKPPSLSSRACRTKPEVSCLRRRTDTLPLYTLIPCCCCCCCLSSSRTHPFIRDTARVLRSVCFSSKSMSTTSSP